jgi:ATP-dependent exoDNAse (exonuclease V) beta subunit
VSPGAGETGPVGFVSGSIDLLYRDPDDGTPVIVDYKTDEVATSAEISAREHIYAHQGAVYVRALRAALDLPVPPRFELWFVAAGEIRRVEADIS